MYPHVHFSFQSFLHDVVCTNKINILCISAVYFFAVSTLNLKWLTDGLCVHVYMCGRTPESRCTNREMDDAIFTSV